MKKENEKNKPKRIEKLGKIIDMHELTTNPKLMFLIPIMQKIDELIEKMNKL